MLLATPDFRRVSLAGGQEALLLLLLLLLLAVCRYHDPVIVDGWSGYQNERNQVSIECCDVPVTAT
jgi:hypothetical protein